MTARPSTKPRVLVVAFGQTAFRRLSLDRWGGPYGQLRTPARWACTSCGKVIFGANDHPVPWGSNVCARNGHAPCRLCGKVMPRLDDGCPREHSWRTCPGKDESDRMQPQHAHKGHLGRAVAS